MRGKDTTPLTVAQTKALFADALTEGTKDVMREQMVREIAPVRTNPWHIRVKRMAKPRPAEARIAGVRYERLIGGWSIQLCFGTYRLHVLLWRE